MTFSIFNQYQFFEQIVSSSPFGMMMPGRKYSLTNSPYRYGFNGKENDNEVKGEGNELDFGSRIYDSRLGKWFSVDPLMKKYPNESNYAFVSNSPILYRDGDGKDKIITVIEIAKDGSQTVMRRIDKNYFYIHDVKGTFNTAYQDRTHKESVSITYTIDNSGSVPVITQEMHSYDINTNYTNIEKLVDFFTTASPKKYGLTMSGGGDGVSAPGQLEWDSGLPKAEQSDYIGSISGLLDALSAYGDLAGVKPGASDITEDFTKNGKLTKALKIAENSISALKATEAADQIQTNGNTGTPASTPAKKNLYEGMKKGTIAYDKDYNKVKVINDSSAECCQEGKVTDTTERTKVKTGN